MKNNDGVNQRETKIIKEEINKNEYDFVLKILKENIGNTIDEFLISNDGNKLTKHLNQGFTMFIIGEMKKSEQQIIEEIKKIIKNKGT